MTATTLRAAVGRYAYTAALSGEPLLDIQPVAGPLRDAMTRMVRDQAYDVCEMSPTSYLMARTAGAPLTAVPVFPYRQFPFRQIVVREDAPVRAPADLEGARIGARTWAQPTAFWLREILRTRYRCNLDACTWVLTAEDPFPGDRRPPGAQQRLGSTLPGLLRSGAVDAVVGLADVPGGCRRLLADPAGEARDWYAATGLIPANHVLVVNSRLAGSRVLPELCGLFERAKRAYLRSGDSAEPVIGELREVTGMTDPLPNGWAANEQMWRVLVEAACRQGMIRDMPAPDAVIEPIEPA